MTFPVLSFAWPMWCVLLLPACRQQATAELLGHPHKLKRLVAEKAFSMQVTCMFYLIEATTKDVVEGGKLVAEQRPPWLGIHFQPLHLCKPWHQGPPVSDTLICSWKFDSACQVRRPMMSLTGITCAVCVGVSVHLVNSIVAWLDIILARPRSFSRRSQLLSIGLVMFYLHWILLCSHINGGFPYPFLNKLLQPQARLPLNWFKAFNVLCSTP